MASELKVDKFTGVAGAGSIVVTAEGNNNTTPLQEGLCKARGNIDGDATTPAFHTGSDSINVASITDVATGRYTITMTNNFSTAFYSQANHMGYRDDAIDQDYGMTFGTYDYSAKTSSANPMAGTYTNGSQYETDHGMFHYFGALA